jgi:hypothetical protein
MACNPLAKPVFDIVDRYKGYKDFIFRIFLRWGPKGNAYYSQSLFFLG